MCPHYGAKSSLISTYCVAVPSEWISPAQISAQSPILESLESVQASENKRESLSISALGDVYRQRKAGLSRVLE